MARTKQTARAVTGPQEAEPVTIETGAPVMSGWLEEKFHREGVEGAFAALFVAIELGVDTKYEFRMIQKFPAFVAGIFEGYYRGEFTYKDGKLVLSQSQAMVPFGGGFVDRTPLRFSEIAGLMPVCGLDRQDCKYTSVPKAKAIWAEVFFEIVCELLRQGIDAAEIAPLREKFIDWAIKIGVDAVKPILATLKHLLTEADAHEARCANVVRTSTDECDDDCLGDCVGTHNLKSDLFRKIGRRVIAILFAPIESALHILELDPTADFAKQLRPKKRSSRDDERDAKRSRSEEKEDSSSSSSSSDEEPYGYDSTDEWADHQPFSLPKFTEKIVRFQGSEYAEFLATCDPEDAINPYNFLITGVISALNSEGRVHSDCVIPDDLNTELARNQWAANVMAEAAGTEDLLEMYEKTISQD